MRVPGTPSELTTRRLLLVGSFLLVSVATTVVFAQAVTGHLAAMHAPSADVTVTDYEVTDDALDVTLHVHNPTMKEIELVSSRVQTTVDGELVTVATRSMLDDVVPSEETKEVTVRLDFREGGEERFRNADPDQIEMRGRIKVEIVDEQVYVRIRGMEASA